MCLGISWLASISDNFKTFLIEQKACQTEWICEIDALRFLDKGLQVVACELMKNVIKAAPRKDPKTIFGYIQSRIKQVYLEQGL